MFHYTTKRWPLILMIFVHHCLFARDALAADSSSNLVFSQLKSGDGAALCAIGDSPVPQTFDTQYREMCEEQCTNHVTGCLRYNWYAYSNGSTLCQLYTSKPTKYGQVPQCAHFTADNSDRLTVACPNSFTYSATTKSCYKIMTALLSWDNAGQTCRQLSTNAHLLAVNDAQEQTNVVDLIKQILSVQQQQACTQTWGYWTSGQRTDPTKKTPFVWKTFPTMNNFLSVDYTNWGARQPDFYGNYESCLHLSSGDAYRWNDAGCGMPMCAVCEIDLNM